MRIADLFDYFWFYILWIQSIIFVRKLLESTLINLHCNFSEIRYLTNSHRQHLYASRDLSYKRPRRMGIIKCLHAYCTVLNQEAEHASPLWRRYLLIVCIRTNKPPANSCWKKWLRRVTIVNCFPLSPNYS